MGIAAATFGDGRDFCIEGESGLKTLHPEIEFNRSIGEVLFPSGCRGKIFSAEKPSRARGPNLYALWCDEFCNWQYQQETWDMLMFALRKGESRTFITTTPKPSKLWRELQARPTSRVVVASTRENLEHLSRAYIENIIKPYEGTHLGRQEIDAEDIEDPLGTLWKRKWIEATRISAIPDLAQIVIPIDPAATSRDTSDEAGIIPVGKAICHCKGRSEMHAFVFDDVTLRGTPDEWGGAAVSAFTKYQADRIIGEGNNGGEMIETIIRYIAKERKLSIPYHMVWASRGKETRAEPVSLLYEQGRVHHVGNLPLLEDEMCNWVPGQGRSPNRVDSLVWGITDLEILGSHDPIR